MKATTTRRPRSKTPARSSRTVLFTGFPGFIGARLIPRLLELQPDTDFVCLVQEKFLPAARKAVEEMAAAHPGTKGRLELVPGDITQSGLGMAEAEAGRLRKRVTGCQHLAAIYDLAVSRDLGLRINVDGTRNVLDYLRECPKLERFDYVSTAYVSGTAVGLYKETDLDVGQRFKNYYEETKFLAEVEVKESGLPAAIYRPGIVVGDSKTGVTAKFDGPYFSLNAMRLLPSPGVFMKVGTGEAPVNLVPVDFVLEAIARLSTWPGAIGKTYALTDPAPLTAFQIEELFAHALGKTFVYAPVPLPIAKLIFAPSPVEKWFGMPSQTLDYFDHVVNYDCQQATKDLARFGVKCPRFADYAQRLVGFYLKHVGEISGKAMA
jgi:thioester reductase-like protein